MKTVVVVRTYKVQGRRIPTQSAFCCLQRERRAGAASAPCKPHINTGF